jgi:alkanesulfonate monooxygenase SsuD/methylene tetrahydromethanopterin reductase-like flavin-dependent oxidoreductase (luciferase family)
MQFGLYLPNQAGFADPRVLASLARDAEHAGWDGIFMWDELFPIYDYAIAGRRPPPTTTSIGMRSRIRSSP